MEETIGECTNLHITYPAMVLGYFALMRANRTVENALEAPTLDAEEDASIQEESPAGSLAVEPLALNLATVAANDIAILSTGAPVEGIIRFHAALKEMTSRRGVRNEISRYEAMALALIEPKGEQAGAVLPVFPPSDSPLRFDRFFDTLYQRYEERFVYGAPLLAGITRRMEWSRESPIFRREERESESWPELDFDPRLAPN
jgi:hypothetical protein